MLQINMKYCFFVTFAVLFIGVQSRAVDSHATDGKACLLGYRTGIKYNGSCFYIEEYSRRTFASVKRQCEYWMDAAVYVPQSIEENNFIMSKTAEMSFTWTGISQNNEQNWDQTSKINVTDLKWDDDNWSSPEQCAVSKNVNGKITLYWTSCEEEHFFICEEINKKEVFTQTPPKDQKSVGEILKCDDGWLHFGEWCYFVEKTDKATFYQAQQECKSKTAALFTPYKVEEYNTVMANTVVYTHTWTELPSNTANIDKRQLPWLINPYDAALNGYNYYTSATCAAYYNGNIESAKYHYYYPCDWKFFYICEKKAVVET